MHQDRGALQPTPDVFGLEFAASQWERLVSNAEGVFHKLIENGLPKDSRTQVEHWLCLKQEYADCLVNDDPAVNFQEKITRSLERIDEVTEYEEISTEERSSSYENDSSDEIDSQVESDSFGEDEGPTCLNSLTVVDNKVQDFEEKLEMFIHKFRELTWDMVNNQFGTKSITGKIDNFIDITNKGAIQKTRISNSRRKSMILPETSPHCISSTFPSISMHYGYEDDSKLMDKYHSNLNKSDELNSNIHNSQCYDKSITEKYKAIIALNSEKRWQEVIKQMAGDHAKKVEDMETNVLNLKKKVHKLVKQLKRNEEDKSQGKTIIDYHKRNNEHEEKGKLQCNKFMETTSSLINDKEYLRTDAQMFMDDDKINSKESLRQEIVNMRQTREFLLDQRKNLDTKLNKDKVFTTVEERKFLELDEAIEAIDLAIEYKNEIICGHNALTVNACEREKGEEMLIERLMNLSEYEMRSLLYKYFRKVVDLRESGRKLEQQLADQDHQIETQNWKIRALSNAVQKVHMESERRIVMIHREHEEKLHLMFRHYGGQDGLSSNVGGETSAAGGSSIERDMDKVEALETHPLIQLEGTSPKTAPSKAITIPQQNLKKLQGSLSTHTTKVTRKKNKLIIQQHKGKHMS